MAEPRSATGTRIGRPCIGVIGAGLIGGSIAIRASRSGYPVIVWDQDETIMEKAVIKHALGWGESARVVVERADILVIATYTDSLMQVVRDMAPHLRPGQILMDVASTKVSPMLALDAAPQGVVVVGSHPMAGKAVAGFDNASADLFEDCTWVVCPNDGESVPGPVTRLLVDLGAAQTVVCTTEAQRPRCSADQPRHSGGGDEPGRRGRLPRR